MVANTPTVITFLLYLLAMVCIGWMGYRATNNLSDYILGGRRLGTIVTAFAAGASDMSGWLLMGLPGAIFLSGLSGSWIAIGLVIGAYLNWRFVAARLRVYTEKSGNALTLPEFLANRFEDRSNSLRIVASVAILIFFTLYCASGMVASARLFESIFDLPYSTAIWIGAVATILYVLIGGFLAVSWTDTLQAMLIFVAMLVTPFAIIYASGGLIESIDFVDVMYPEHDNLWSNLGVIPIISLMAWGLGYFGQPHILVRFMATESVSKIPSSMRISLTWMALCLIGAIAVGYFGVAYFAIHPNQAEAVNLNSERVFIEVAKYLFNPWVSGILLAAILAAIMSTLSCQLLMCASTLTEDIYRKFFRKTATQTELLTCSRLMVLFISAISIWLAWDPNSGILKMVSYAWAGFGSAFGPVILLSLLWPRMTRNGALAGMVIGTVVVLVWNSYAWFGLYEIIPGFIFATLGIIIVSLLSKPPSRDIQMQFDAVAKEVRIG